MNFTKDFFNLLLNFGDKWVITNIESNHKTHEIYLDVEYDVDYYEDPLTFLQAQLCDHVEVCVWQHLDILHYKSYVRCRISIVRCFNGKVRQISGWTDKHDRNTFSFEIRVIDLVKVIKNQSKTSEYLNSSFRLASRNIHRSTQRGMERRNYSHIPSEHIIIDEKSFRKGHQYVTVISHSRSGIILDVGQGRDRISTKLLLKKILKKAQLGSIHKVSLDMWSPYMKSVKQKAFNAEIVHDKFHLIKYLNQAIDKVRHREVQKNQVLKKSRYVMLENDQKLIAKQIAKHQMIKDSNFEISKAMNIQENFKSVFDYCHDEGGVIEILTCWAQDSYQKFIKEINKKVVTTFFKHAWDIVNSLISVLNITMSERLYVKIQVIKIAAIGFGKFQNYESAILFFHGWLGLYPENIIRTTTKVI